MKKQMELVEDIRSKLHSYHISCITVDPDKIRVLIDRRAKGKSTPNALKINPMPGGRIEYLPHQ